MLIPIILFLQATVYLNIEAKVLIPQPLSDGRIVGGHDVDIAEVPFQISLQANGRHTCGGSLVARDIVITAAHCINNARYQVRVGSSYHAQGGQVYEVRRILKHPNYNQSPFDCDVAIVWLAQPVSLSKAVGTVQMKGPGEEVPDNAPVQVTGWGDTYPKHWNASEEADNPDMRVGSATLKKVMLVKYNQEECNRAYQTTYVPITKYMICAGEPQGGKGSCQGDSGGPLIHNGKLAGIVSFAVGCARPDFPTVYARVSTLRNWIDQNMNSQL